MTDDELAAIEQRVQAATPGPWCEVRAGVDVPAAPERGSLVSEDGDLEQADAAFIAHAREDVPALLAEVRRLQGRVEDYQRSFDEKQTEVERLRAEATNLANIIAAEAKRIIAEYS